MSHYITTIYDAMINVFIIYSAIKSKDRFVKNIGIFYLAFCFIVFLNLILP